MKHLIIVAVTGILLAVGLVMVSIPTGWDVVPVINNYFSMQTGLWQNARLADDVSEFEITHRRLERPVQIQRTDRGVPIIDAVSYKDAMVALGYISARDRYYQMALQPRLVQGAVSEWYGDSYQSVDRAFLELGLEKAAWDQLQNMSEENYELISAYSSGVNKYINDHFHTAAPVEFKLHNLPNRYWRPVDSMRSVVLMAYRSAFNYDDILYQKAINETGADGFREYYPFAGAQPEVIDSYNHVDLDIIYEQLRGDQRQRNRFNLGLLKPVESNAMLFPGRHTADGSVNWTVDIHSLATHPSVWYEARIVLPDRELHGITLPGYPGFWTMASDRVAYSLTDAGVDETDWYHIELNSDSTMYRYDGEWHNFHTQSYQIAGEEEDESFSVDFTRHGPMVEDGMVFTSVFHRKTMNPHWMQQLALSDSTAELRQLTNATESRPMKIFAADRTGEGFKGLTGQLPIRPSPVGLKDGSDPEYNRTDVVPASELPAVDQTGGLLYSADELFSWYDEHYLAVNPPMEWRYNRIRELGEELLPFNNSDISDIVTDTRIPQHELHFLFEQANETHYDVTLRRLTDLLGEWDYRATRESRLTLLMDYLMRTLDEALWGDLTDMISPSEKAYWEELTQGYIAASHNPEAAYPTTSSLMSEVILDSYDLVMIEHGRVINWSWENNNKLQLEHPSGLGRYSILDYGSISRAGFRGTLNPAPNRNSRYASTYRLSVNWDENGNQTRQSYLLGAPSGDPVSRFYQPSISEWERGQLFRAAPLEL